MEQFEEFPEDGWARAMAVVAHPDDMEYGAAGAVARWTRMGREVTYLLACKGEAGIDSMPPEETAVLRMAEQRAACAVVGVDTVEFLDHRDGVIEYGLELRRDIARAIRTHRPDIILTINHHDSWGPGSPPNMADHRNVGLAVLDAVRDAANRWVFPELALEKWDGVQYVAVAGSPQPTHAVDISETLETSIECLSQHEAYLNGLGDSTMSDPDEMLRAMALQTAQRFAGRKAVAFELIPM